MEYIEFLIRHHNGGQPAPKFLKIPNDKGERIGQVLDFFGVDDPVESCNIKWNCAVFSGRIPSNLVPIACEDEGNIICLEVGSNNCGKVYYWDHNRETSLPSFENVDEIADSFDRFINGLFAYEIDELLLQHAMGTNKA